MPIAAALVAAFGSSPPAIAQGAAAQSKLELEEVTVTARKREESLLEVPISITAVSEEAIAAYNIRDLNDLQRVTPGFQLNESNGFRRARDTFTLVIRGLNIGNSTTLSSAATIFMDGAPLVGGRPSSFHDVERIEVLKGPQTAYFGRSTFSGAINLVTRDPGNEWGGQVTGELGRFGTSDALFSVEGPILDDKLTFRATARNLVNGAQYTERTYNGPVGERTTQSGSLTMLYKPTDKLRVKIFGEYSEFHDSQTSVFDFPMNEFANCRVGTSTTNNWICGEAPATGVAISRLGNPSVLDPRFLNALVPQSIYRNLELDSGDQLASYNITTHAIADYSFDNGLTLSAIAAYHSNKVQSLEESTQDNKFGFFPCPLPAGCGRPFGQYLFLIDQERRDRSFEMRLTSGQEQRLRWLVGVNYSNAVRQVWNGGEIPTTPVPQTFGLNALENTETTGVFAGLNLDIVGGLSAGLEMRYQQDQVFFNPNRRVDGQRTVEETFNSATPRVSLQYKFDNGQMLYASYAEGVRPGGFNGALLARPQFVIDLLADFDVKVNIEEEELKVFEVGLKGRLLDDRLQTTVAVYKGKLVNQQVNQSIFINTPTFTNTIGFTNNAGQTDIQGVEIEASYLVTDRLRLDGGFGFYDTEIIKDSCSQCVRIASSLTSSVGKRLDGTPVASGNLTGSYTVPLANERDWYSRVEYFYVGKQYGDRLNLSYAPATNVVNLRSGLNNGPFDFEAYVTNVFDQDNYQNVLLNTDLPSFGIALKVGLPDRRQWGLRGTYRF